MEGGPKKSRVRASKANPKISPIFAEMKILSTILK
jgi:hypothetical protein